MSDEIRVYGTIFADFPAGSVSDADWQLLTNAAKQQPLSSAIISAVRASQNYITAHKRSLNATYLRLYTLFGFEIDRRDINSLIAVLEAEATAHNVTGSTRNKFIGVIQAELRTAALGLGYTQVQADKLSVDLINQPIANTFQRDVAIQQAQDFLAANTAIWYE